MLKGKMMNVNEAIKYLEEQIAGAYWARERDEAEKYREIVKLLKRLPQTKDGFHVLPGDSLEPCKDVDYLCGMVGEPEIVMQAHYILESGQHVTDGIQNFNKGELDEGDK